MSEVVYQKGESRIEAEVGRAAIINVAPLTWSFSLIGCVLLVVYTPEIVSEYPWVAIAFCGGAPICLSIIVYEFSKLISGRKEMLLGINGGCSYFIPLSPTSPKPCEEPEFKAAYTKAINEMKAEIDKIEAERGEKNARRDACVASLKEMAK